MKKIIIIVSLAIGFISVSCSKEPTLQDKLKEVTIVNTNFEQLSLFDYLQTLNQEKPIVVVTSDAALKITDSLQKALEQNNNFELLFLNLTSGTKNDSLNSRIIKIEKANQIKYPNSTTTLFNPSGEFAKNFLDYTDPIYERENGVNSEITNIFILYKNEIIYQSKILESNFLTKIGASLITDLIQSKDTQISNSINSESFKFNYQFKNLKPEGVWTIVDTLDNKSITVESYENGLKSGEWQENFFTDTKPLLYVGNYKNNQKTGVWKYYYENGQIKSITTYVDGEIDGNYKDYYDTGKLKRDYNNIKGKTNGEFKGYNSNGTLSAVGNYNDDEKSGEWKYYYDNGQVKRIGNYINGELDGEWKYYYDNGQLEQFGNYINGKADGEWKIFHKNGNPFQVRSWENDKLIDIYTSLDANGKPLNKGTIANGNGTRIIYDNEGKIKKTENYINGEKEDGYMERITDEATFKAILATKIKPQQPQTDANKLTFNKFSIKKYAVLDNDQYIVSIPFEVPKTGEINLFSNGGFSWRVVSENISNQGLTFSNYSISKEATFYVDGEKIVINKGKNKLNFNCYTQGGYELDMENLRGKTCYISFNIPKKYYNNNSFIYFDYYVHNNYEEIEAFNANLKSLE